MGMARNDYIPGIPPHQQFRTDVEGGVQIFSKRLPVAIEGALRARCNRHIWTQQEKDEIMNDVYSWAKFQ